MKQNSNISKYQWYIATTYSGREDSVVRDLHAKIKSLNLLEYVKTIRTFKTKVITEKLFDSSNPPPAHMRNSKNIRWEKGNRPNTYKKIETRIVNKFPGYIFIEMVLNDKVWLAIRNSLYITGFVGSSGKGAKPIPISSDELQIMLFDDPLSTNSDSDKTKQSETNSKFENNLDDKLIDIEFEIGQHVKITDGDWKDQIGIIKNIDNRTGIVTIDIEFLGSLNTINTSYTNLVSAE